MNKILDDIKKADKRKLTIYLLSFLLFLVYNNILSNLIIYPFKHETFINVTGHVVPCPINQTLIYLITFELIKTITFIVFLFYVKRHPKTLFAEIFVAYFIYDLVYLLAVFWDAFILPQTEATQMLFSSPQIIFDGYVRHLNLLVYGIWTCLLLTILYKQKLLTFKYLFYRLPIIPFSVALTTGMIYLFYRCFR